MWTCAIIWDVFRGLSMSLLSTHVHKRLLDQMETMHSRTSECCASGLSDSRRGSDDTMHLTYRLLENMTICTLSVHISLTQCTVNKAKEEWYLRVMCLVLFQPVWMRRLLTRYWISGLWFVGIVLDCWYYMKCVLQLSLFFYSFKKKSIINGSYVIVCLMRFIMSIKYLF